MKWGCAYRRSNYRDYQTRSCGKDPPNEVGKKSVTPKKKKKTSSTRNRSSAKYWFPRPPHSLPPLEMEGYAVVAVFWEKILGEHATTDKSNEYVREGGLNDRVTGTSFSICQEILCKNPPSFLPPPPSLFFFLLPHKSFHKKKKRNENRKRGGGLARTGFTSNSRDFTPSRDARAGGPRGGGQKS